MNALRGAPVDRVPATSVTQVGLVELMEKTGAKWPEAHSNPEFMAKLAAAPYCEVGLETARVPFCLTVQASAMGCEIVMGAMDRQPSVAGHLDVSPDQLRVPEDFLSRGRIPVVLEAVKILKREVGGEVPVMAGFEGPFTLAGHLMGIERLCKMVLRDPQGVERAVQVATEANLLYIKALQEAGVDVLVPCDPLASPAILSPSMFKKFVKPYLEQLVKESKVPIVLHICGNTTPILKDMAEAGFTALSIEEKVEIAKAKEIVGDMSRVVGNIAPAGVLLTGTPDQVREECLKALKDGVDALAPGCGLAPRTPVANIKAMVEAAQSFSR